MTIAQESSIRDEFMNITLMRNGGYSPIELVTIVQALIDSIRQPADLKLANARQDLVAPV